MFGPVNRIPFGLAGFFNFKDGAFPLNLQENYQPTLDLLAWLKEANGIEPQTATVGAVAAIGTSSLVGPPSNEIWLVRAATAFGFTTAAENLRLRLVQLRAIGGSYNQVRAWPEGASSLTDAVGVGTAYSSSAPNDVILLLPGETLGVLTTKITSAGLSVTVHAHICSFHV